MDTKAIPGALLDATIVIAATVALCLGHLSSQTWLFIMGPIVGARVAMMRDEAKARASAAAGSAVLLLLWFLLPRGHS